MGVQLAPHVLEPHLPQLGNQQLRLGEQRLQPGVLHAVHTEHLLHQQFGIRPDDDVAVAVLDGVPQRGEQAVVFGDVVRGDADRAAELNDQRAVGGLDANAVPAGPGFPRDPPSMYRSIARTYSAGADADAASAWVGGTIGGGTK